jgi:hypothetical protein
MNGKWRRGTSNIRVPCDFCRSAPAGLTGVDRAFMIADVEPP